MTSDKHLHSSSNNKNSHSHAADSTNASNSSTKNQAHDATAGGGSTGSDAAIQAYQTAQDAYHKQLDQYWQVVDAAKKAQTKVTTFPPAYDGPAKPAGYGPPKTPSTLPSVNDMLSEWQKFAPMAAPGLHAGARKIDQTSEDNFKHAYAREALVVGAKYGLNKAETQNVVENIYAFEDAGKGTADLLSGVPLGLTAPDAPGSHTNEDARRNVHPLSTGMGYNQLLMATSLRFIDGSKAINDRLKDLATADPANAQTYKDKEKLLEDVQKTVRPELLAMGKTNPGKYLDSQGNPNYALYTDFAASHDVGAHGLTGRQMTSAIQALNLDKEIGPVLQAQQLDDIISHSFKPTFKADLQQKVQDDANAIHAFDSLPGKDKTAAVSEILDHVAPAGSQSTARQILEKQLDAYCQNDKTLLTEAALGANAYNLLSGKIVGLKKYGDQAGPLSPAASGLVEKLYVNHFNDPSAYAYLPAAVELANLAGSVQAQEMLKSANGDYPTVNFFDRQGYEANGLTNGRTADELLKAIYSDMQSKNGPSSYGMTKMNDAFDDQ